MPEPQHPGHHVGYLPILVLVPAVPEFAAAVWDSIRAVFERGTNLPLPVPWPWLVPVTQLPPSTAAADVLMGEFFIAIVAFGVSSVVWILRQARRQRPVPSAFVACSVLALPYAHFAFSRANVGHLAQGIFPFLISVFILLKAWPNRARWLVALAMTAASLLVMLPLHPGWAVTNLDILTSWGAWPQFACMKHAMIGVSAVRLASRNRA
jgi:uncharacterized membrane protein YjdF